MANELIVRELASVVTSTISLAAGASQIFDNVARFFNDTPYNLDLVAIRLGSIPNVLAGASDAATSHRMFAVTEVSRQAIAGQQEGIVANVRGVVSLLTKLNANGGAGNCSVVQGEMLFGDFKTPMMTLEVQTNLFMHVVMTNMGQSSTAIGSGAGEAAVGATLYFKKRGRR